MHHRLDFYGKASSGTVGSIRSVRELNHPCSFKPLHRVCYDGVDRGWNGAISQVVLAPSPGLLRPDALRPTVCASLRCRNDQSVGLQNSRG